VRGGFGRDILRVLLTNVFNFFNKGEEAMIASVAMGVKKHFPDVEFAIVPIYSYIDMNTCKRYGIEVSGHMYPPSKLRLGLRASILLIRMLLSSLISAFGIRPNSLLGRELRSYTDSDVVIDLGGDTFSDDPSIIYNMLHCFSLLPAIFFKKPFIIMAQSIGPFKTPVSKFVAKFILDQAVFITAREVRTKNYLSKLGVKRPVYETTDLAFMLEPDREEAKKILKDKRVDLNAPIIGVNPSQVISKWMYLGMTRKQKHELYVELMKKFVDHLSQKALVIMIPHVTGPPRSIGPLGSPDDRIIMREIYSKLENKKNVLMIEDYSVEVYRGIIGMCDMFIGSRFHAVVSAISEKVPFLSLAYSHKAIGIIRDGLGLGDLIVDVRGKDQNTLTTELISAVDRIWQNKDAIRKSLEEKVPALKELSLSNIALISGTMQTVKQIYDRGLCAGCGTCSGVCPVNCITMRMTDDGLYAPYINDKICTKCGLCFDVCPGVSVNFNDLNKRIFKNISTDLSLGNSIKCYLGHSTDEKILRNSTSGGIVTTLLTIALERGIIDGVLVVASRENTLEPEPKLACTKADILLASGSKYCQVPLNVGIRKILSENGKFAVVGLPCHIHGIRKAEMLNEKLKNKIVLHVGLFCAHAVSFSGIRFLLKSMNVDEKDVRELKYRARGWARSGLLVKLKNGDEKFVLSFRYWKRLFGLYFFTPPRCLTCCDATAELADISCGDAWLSELKDSKIGHSIFMSRTNVGESLIQLAISEKKLEIQEVHRDKVVRSQKMNIAFKKRGLGVRSKMLKPFKQEMPRYNIALPKANLMACAVSLLSMISKYASAKKFLHPLLRVYCSYFVI